MRGSCALVLWHGYLLAGRVERLHAGSRASGPAGTTSPSSPRSRTRSVRPRRRARRPARTSAGCCPSSCSTATRATRSSSCRTAPGRSSTTGSSANAAAVREHAAGRPRLLQPRPPRRAGGAATGARYAVKAHGSELEYSMRGNAELAGLGTRKRSRGAEAVFVGSAHIREVLEDVVGHVDRVARGAARASTSTSWRPAPARRGARRPARGGAARSAESRQRERAAAGRGQRRAPRRVPRRRPADRRLLREAALQQGRPRAARGAARTSTRAP